MTDEITTPTVDGGSYSTIGEDGYQYVADPFSGTNDVVLQAITEQVNGQDQQPQESELPGDQPKEEVEAGQESDSTVDEEAPEETDTTEEESPGDEPADAPKKFYKVLIDGKETDLPDTATIKLKVDGKTVKVSVAELASDYNGRAVYASRFSELGRKEKAFEQKQMNWELQNQKKTAAFKEAAEALQHKNPLKAILCLARSEGLNTKEQFANFLVAADKSLADWIKLDPQNRQTLLNEIELQDLRDRDAEIKRTKEAETASQKFIEETYDIVQEAGFTIQDYIETSKWMIENTPEVFKENDQAFNRQKVLDTLVYGAQTVEIEGIAQKVNPQKYNSFSQEQKQDFIAKMLKYKAIGEWNSPKDLEDMLLELWGKPKPKQPTSSASPAATGKAPSKPSAPRGSENKPNPAQQVDDILNMVRESDIFVG